jgi:hypothetical protein
MLIQRRITTQDISWFLDQYRTEQLDLDPPYQRRSVWSLKERQFFLDTIFHNYPSPAIFLYRTIDNNGRHQYHVVDGKQRLETIIKFSNNELSLAKDFGDVQLNGKKWNDLDQANRQLYWNYVLSVELLPSVEKPVVNEVFERFNRNARKLEAQELRHARYDGWFITFAEKEAEKEFYIKLKIVTATQAKRMKDVQFVSELLLMCLDHKIVGFDQLYLDKKYGEYDSPGDNVSDFSEQDFLDDLAATKEFIEATEEVNKVVSRRARTATHFYTLWALITLERERLPEASAFAVLYEDFMKKVEDLKQSDLDTTVSDVPDPAFIYAKNSTGAVTEFPQRQARLESLKSLLPQ